MKKFNHGVEFESVKTDQRVSFSDVAVIMNRPENERDSLDESDSFNRYKKHKIHKDYRRQCCAIISVILVILLFIGLLIICSRNYPDNNLTARLPYHHHHKTIEEQCNSTRYGCCEVYDLCHNHKNDNFTYIHQRIWPSVEIKHNKMGTNCPRLNQIVYKYSHNYYPSSDNHYHCKNSTYGCCSIDISCDVYIYLRQFINNISYSYTGEEIIRYINHEKIDPEGSNCPSINYIVSSYNRGLNSSLDSIILLFIIGGFITGCYGCIDNCKCR